MQRKYYEAYDERYKTIHGRGVSWSSDQCTPCVMDIIRRYHITTDMRLLEIGCGEGRDAKTVLDHGYHLLSTDVSPEAIRYCQDRFPQYKDRFRVMDCLSCGLPDQFDFIYAVAVVHMLVPDLDRDGFYQFIRNHLTEEGIALICTMGDGTTEMKSDVRQAFELQERNHETGTVSVACTSCRMVSFQTFKQELSRNGLSVLESEITGCLPDFDRLMYAVVQKAHLR